MGQCLIPTGRTAQRDAEPSTGGRGEGEVEEGGRRETHTGVIREHQYRLKWEKYSKSQRPVAIKLQRGRVVL